MEHELRKVGTRAAALRSTAIVTTLATALALVLGSHVLANETAAKQDVPAAQPAGQNGAPKKSEKKAEKKTDKKADKKTEKTADKKKADKKSEKTAKKTDEKKSETKADKTADKAKATSKSKSNKTSVATAPSATIAPATRSHAALPPPAARKPAVPAAVASTSSTSSSDKEALENVIDLVRKHKPADATEAEAAIADPLARKLAEWIILRSDDNGATVERYRAFVSANPSWPSQSFLRRRMEAAFWDDRREDAAVWSWFQNESPISAKGKLALARSEEH